MIWVERWNDTIASDPDLPGVWRRRDGGFHIRGRATDPKTGKLREINRSLPTCKRARAAAAELDAALDEIRTGARAEVSTGVPRFADYAVELFARKVASGDIASAAGREKWRTILEKHLIPRFGDWYLDKITKRDIEAWKVSLTEAGYAPTTGNTMLAVLKTILGAASEDFEQLVDPSAKVAPFNLKAYRTYTAEAPNSLPAEDVWRFLDETRVRWPEHYAMIYLGMITGWRPSMLRPLRRKGPHADLNWETGELKARRSHTIGAETMAGTKTGLDETVRLPKDAVDVLRWHAERLDTENEKRARRFPDNAAAMERSELLFPALPNGRNKGGGFRSKDSLDRAFEDVGHVLGMAYKVTPRALRRSFQDLAREAGISDVLTRGICGHRTPAMTARYSTVGLAEKQAAIGKLIDFAAAKRARETSPPATPPERSRVNPDAPLSPPQVRETPAKASG